MITLFGGRITLGRLPSEQQRHKELLRQWKKIMATLNEVTEQLKLANEKLVESNGIINDTKGLVVKVGTETDKLKDIIANLPPPGDAPQELVDALETIKATVAAQSALVAETKTAIGVVDDKVEDAPPAE